MESMIFETYPMFHGRVEKKGVGASTSQWTFEISEFHAEQLSQASIGAVL